MLAAFTATFADTTGARSWRRFCDANCGVRRRRTAAACRRPKVWCVQRQRALTRCGSDKISRASWRRQPLVSRPPRSLFLAHVCSLFLPPRKETCGCCHSWAIWASSWASASSPWPLVRPPDPWSRALKGAWLTVASSLGPVLSFRACRGTYGPRKEAAHAHDLCRDGAAATPVARRQLPPQFEHPEHRVSRCLCPKPAPLPHC